MCGCDGGLGRVERMACEVESESDFGVDMWTDVGFPAGEEGGMGGV